MSAPSTKSSTTEKLFEGSFLAACAFSALGASALLSFYSSAYQSFKDWLDAVISAGLLAVFIALILWTGAIIIARTWPRRAIILVFAALTILSAGLGFSQALQARRDLGFKDETEPYQFTFRRIPVYEAITPGSP